MSESKIVLIGYSGHGLVVADSLKSIDSIQLVGYIDKDQKQNNPFDLDYLGSENTVVFSQLRNQKLHVILGIGDNNIRKKVFKQYESEGIEFFNVIDKTSNISQYVNIGIGNYFSKNSVANSFSTIHNNCIINTGCIVEHECIIDSHVHIAPGAVLSGNVKVGEGSFIGANSVVKQGVSIGKNVIVGAGSVVLKDIPDNEVWVGNPAKKIKNG